MKLWDNIISYFQLKLKQRKCKHMDAFPAGHVPGIYDMYCPDCKKEWVEKE